MLTGLDFPRELYYGPNGLWVRNDGAGAVRVGVHFFTLERQTRVVHAQLPKPGERIAKGYELGYLDLDGATFPLVAPVSGVVFCPNPDLRLDADLVRQDAFGGGYLLDLEDVDSTDLDELLDADEAMAAYSTFEPPSSPRASMTIEPDRPWWTTLELGFGETTVVRARIMPPLSNEVFAPDWDIGQRWTVETLVQGNTRRYDYEVLGETRLKGEPCVRVRAVERVDSTLSDAGVALQPPPISRVLYFRLASFTLLAYDIVPAESPTHFQRVWNERGENAFMRYEPEDGFYYDHAFIPPGRTDVTRELPELAPPPGSGRPALPALVDYYRFRGGGYRCEVELRSRLKSELGVEERWFSQQIWIAGQPWWSEAVRMCGDKVLIKASLVV